MYMVSLRGHGGDDFKTGKPYTTARILRIASQELFVSDVSFHGINCRHDFLHVVTCLSRCKWRMALVS